MLVEELTHGTENTDDGELRREMIDRRRAFLEHELHREQESYHLVSRMTTERSKAGLKIIALTIALIETEIAWIDSRFGDG